MVSAVSFWEATAASREFVAEPHRTTYPRFLIDAVVEAPWGAYPTSNFPSYTHDEGFFGAYQQAARNPDDFKAFLEERVFGPETWPAFLDANGGAETLLRIRRRTS